MTSIRIAIAAAFAVGAVLVGASAVQHTPAPRTTVVAGAIHSDGVTLCCDDDT